MSNIYRWYYKSTDCLTPVTYSDKVRILKCACGGKMLIMGEVIKGRITNTEELTVCDARCTEATGPSCNCKCRGEHHGTGRTVQIITDLGSGEIKAEVNAEAIDRGRTWRALVESAYNRVALKFGSALDVYKKGGFIS